MEAVGLHESVLCCIDSLLLWHLDTTNIETRDFAVVL